MDESWTNVPPRSSEDSGRQESSGKGDIRRTSCRPGAKSKPALKSYCGFTPKEKSEVAVLLGGIKMRVLKPVRAARSKTPSGRGCPHSRALMRLDTSEKTRNS